MKRKLSATDFPNGGAALGGLFEAVPETASAVSPAISGAVSPGQARLMALFPAARIMLLWQMATGWKPCTVVSVRPEGTASCRVTVQQGDFTGEVRHCDLKPLPVQ